MQRLSLPIAIVVILANAISASADDRFPPVTNDSMLNECTDCHIAYQPQMLPQRSWRKILNGITDHFGEELEVSKETQQEILVYLLDNAADRSKRREAQKFLRGISPESVPIRITETPRWRKKHEELPSRFWKDKRVESEGDCSACHTKAEKGLYDDDDGLRVPGPNDTWSHWEDD